MFRRPSQCGIRAAGHRRNATGCSPEPWRQAIAGLLDDPQALLAVQGVERAELLTEFDWLISDLECHLTYEEEHLIPNLDGIDGP